MNATASPLGAYRPAACRRTAFRPFPALSAAIAPAALVLAAVLSASALLASAAPALAADEGEGPFGRSLVAVFSQTGKTMRLAEIISRKTGSEIFRIEPAEPFPADEREIVAFEEKRRRDGVQVELLAPPPDLSGYDVVFLGSPTWFGERPDVVAAFLLEADFQGADVAIFATSGTRPGNLLPSLKALVKNGNVLAPTLLQRRADDQSDEAVEKRVDDWIEAVRLARE